ncbi:hypothetical protein [Streptomyces olivochromogenes]|uniref:Uncharacterized protein n=1 Tax=Streptomyces olivochromogenes TaxID=1963 RepID=A0A250VT81_STROL|nr:hypothetical protein [Streptomyces olivochromogenes]KUN38226.1 hypothetical protein AQJ27_44805 [Streptomyces olivochromogenes]GAX57335.1 hypothetical protein SO3561_08905 [Streptomyces olivochromogenes]
MALMEAESGLCGDCGHLLSETTQAEAEFAYDASITKCHACLAGARRVAAHQEDGGKTEGLKVSVFRREQ